jgi:hypothetical protein
MANSFKDTQRTRHIARRYHYLRFAIHNGELTVFKIIGTSNPANSLTKPLPIDQLTAEAAIYQMEVDE